jgi:hypothetical protein
MFLVASLFMALTFVSISTNSHFFRWNERKAYWAQNLYLVELKC